MWADTFAEKSIFKLENLACVTWELLQAFWKHASQGVLCICFSKGCTHTQSTGFLCIHYFAPWNFWVELCALRAQHSYIWWFLAVSSGSLYIYLHLNRTSSSLQILYCCPYFRFDASLVAIAKQQQKGLRPKNFTATTPQIFLWLSGKALLGSLFAFYKWSWCFCGYLMQIFSQFLLYNGRNQSDLKSCWSQVLLWMAYAAITNEHVSIPWCNRLYSLITGVQPVLIFLLHVFFLLLYFA